MQLRKNQVESVERKIQHSLVEPALRLKHSLQEPVLRLRHSLQDATMKTAAGSASSSTTTSTLLSHPPPPAGPTASLRGLPPPFAPASTAASKVKVVRLNQPIPGTIVASMGPIGTAKRIIQREGFLALYKGLTAVYMGIIPKMAIRFVSFEQYKDWLNDYTVLGRSTTATFTAGLLSGLTEAVLVVTPAEVCKVRLTC